jgi:hypothetical protein
MNARKGFPIAGWIAAAACAAVMIWIGGESDGISDAYKFTGLKTDYYSRLVSGFTHGHLYLNVAADPRLSGSDEEMLGRPLALQDASFFHGHFYLYYGVVPAVVLLLPYHLLTGQDLGINTACIIFWLSGFLVSICWLRNWWNDCISRGSSVLAVLAVAVLAFFPATAFLVRRAMFYELPLVAGYACISIFFAALYECLQGRRHFVALSISSAALGLAVGCHPNHIFLLPILLWVALSGARRDRPARNCWRDAAAALFPATLIGVGLASYNYSRFGSVFEFGFRFGQNGFFAANASIFVPRYFWANFKWYFLTPPTLTPYFPFVYPGNNTFAPPGYVWIEAMHGAIATTLFAFWVLLGLATSLRSFRARTLNSPMSAILVWSALAGILFVCCLQIRANRYMADFETPLAWLLASSACVVWEGLSGVVSRTWKMGLLILTLAGVLLNGLAAIQQFDLFRNTRPLAFSGISLASNVPYSWIYDGGIGSPGPVSMMVHFKVQGDLAIEPLVTTGTPGYSDSVNIAQYPNQTVQFRFDHRGYGGPMSAYIPIDFTRAHHIEISMGSLYPPNEDAYFGGFSAGTARLLKSLAYVRLDGKVVMCTTASFYESPPWSRQIGSNKVSITEFKRAFSGEIEDTGAISTECFLDELGADARAGILSFKVHFPERPPLSGLPLLGCGVQGDGNLVFAKSEGGSSYRIEMDDWGYGALAGKPFSATGGEHKLQIVLGPLVVRSRRPAEHEGIGNISPIADRIVVRLDGEILGDFKVDHHLKQIGKLTIGANPQGFSTAIPKFDGAFEAFPLSDAEVQDLLAEALHESTP